MNPLRRETALAIFLGILFTLALPADVVGQVLVRSQKVGQGIMRGRGRDCFVLTPFHVIEKHVIEKRTDPVAVVGPQGIEAQAIVERTLAGDLAVLALTPGSGLVCDEWLPLVAYESSIEALAAGHLSMREADGSRTLVPVTFRAIDGESIYVRASMAGDVISQGMSGASLIANGAVIGLLLSVEKGEGRVLQLDDIVRLSEPFFAAAAPLMDLTLAQATLDRALQARDGSMQGQGDAVASMVARGQTFRAANWNGVAFRGTSLAKGSFRGSMLRFSDLTGAIAPEADFTASDLAFATVDKAQMPGAIITRSYAPFLQAADVNWQGADLSNTQFFSATLTNSRFDKARLRGTNFAFADLRGAVFDGADLTGAFFIGAVMDATTSFKNARLEDTDFLGAAAAAVTLTPEQLSRTCYHPLVIPHDERGFSWGATINERWRSQRFPSGFEAEPLVEEQWYFNNFTDRSLAICKGTLSVMEDMDLGLPAMVRVIVDRDYVAKVGRREEVEERVKQHLALLRGALRVENIVRGSGAPQALRWRAALGSAAENASPVGEPYITQDQLLLMLLKAGVVGASSVDWTQVARARHALEQAAIKNGQPLRDHSMWPAFFPADAPTTAQIHEAAAESYKTWTLARVANAGNRLIAKRAAPPLDPMSKVIGYPLTLVLPSSSPEREYEEVPAIWAQRGSAKLEAAGISPDRVVFPLNLGAPTRQGAALLVLPAAINTYRIPVPVDTVVPADAVLEVDLSVEKVEAPPSILTEVSGLLFVKPNSARVRSGGRIVWAGDVLQSPAAK